MSCVIGDLLKKIGKRPAILIRDYFIHDVTTLPTIIIQRISIGFYLNVIVKSVNSIVITQDSECSVSVLLVTLK